MNFYSSDEYLDALAETWFPGRRHAIGLYGVGGRVFRLLSVEGHGTVVSDDPRPGARHYLDFFDPVEREPGGPCAKVRWLPHAALGAQRVEAVPPRGVPCPPGVTPAPYIDWSMFRDWEAFQAHFLSRRSSLARDSRRKQRHLERDLGPLRYVWDDRDPASFGTVLVWKSAQYVRSNVRDELSVPENRHMFLELWRRGLLLVSSLRAGGRLVAAHLGVVWDGRFFSWLPAYDRDLATYSPGRLLLEDLFAESLARGHRQFDFLIGCERYKYYYATHSREVGSIGVPPLPVSVRQGARALVKRALSVYPPLLERARALEHRWAGGQGRAPLALEGEDDAHRAPR
jgi:hypothetical protein